MKREVVACMVKHGLVSPAATQMDVFQAYGKLANDRVLGQRRVALAREAGTPIVGFLVEAVDSLAPNELLELRHRITGVSTFRNTRSRA